MDFSRLPEPAFLKIFEYLPLEDCVRVGRVNKTFRHFSQLATSRTKCLDLTERRFRKLTSDQLAVILDLCSSKLERIKFGVRQDHHWQQMAITLANFEYPRLNDMNLGDTPIDQAVFHQLIRNCPNMESLVWRKDFVGFPAITNNHLKKLNINVYNAASLQTLIGRCPNLEQIVLVVINLPPYVLDEFFASVPRVQRIEMDLVYVNSDEFETHLVSFWNLVLTSLKVNFYKGSLLGESLLHKVVTSFPHLQELAVGYVLMPTSASIASLAALQDLEDLQLGLWRYGYYDQGIRQLSSCQKLRKLDVFQSNMTGGTLVHLVRSCSHLEYVRVWNSITQVDSPKEAVVVLDSLAGTSKRDITISFRHPSETIDAIWKAEAVKAAIKKLKEIDGLKITIG